jgi:hypothetical protein
VLGTVTRVRAFVGCALALGPAVPVVLSASPALAAGCTASVPDPHPAQNETVTVSFVGPASASATVVAHYHAVDNSATTTTDVNGHGSVGFDVGGAPYNETVIVDVTIGSASCSMSIALGPTGPIRSRV